MSGLYDGMMAAYFTGTNVQPTPPTPGPDYTEPFYIENPNNSNITGVIQSSSYNAPVLTVEYSTDKTNWSVLGSTSSTLNITITPNSKVYLRSNTDGWSNGYNNLISATSTFNIGGNIMSLLYGGNFTGNETTFPGDGLTIFPFLSLFSNNSNLTDVSNLLLPATTLVRYCYAQMFRNCSSITTAPELPATTLASGCYQYMFDGCRLLTQAPELPATTVYDKSYMRMFQNCTSLTTAPELPATTLINESYREMFNGCSSLNYVKCLATDISATSCTSNWVNGVANSGTFVKYANMSSWTTGSSGIPTGWTVQDA